VDYDSVHDTAHCSTAYSHTQKLDLHQDSGADLSECHDQHEPKSTQNLVTSYEKSFEAKETEIENEYENVDVLLECNQISGN